ncbi:MogA/MoaB family molybdenum cofactor biosynthesis protein [Microbacterium allomyrinae]|uniref:MogA/MoaB family molybdenum cofactor biosynthesis protein n=1 Tax=Microbacterium allomyrinae TaxID=2830666 RepID=A0A9X1LT46_9MICO|nr:MogA/MoaB family molybdenum cofactor biosynthesis protein [Microbacterium allomyrinae]MCC2031163.1 MogA/MoaB family molybdenum cofactor biosynthesis protein [Microbacterium allomyrinae]
MSIRAVVITVSDRSAAGEREDTSGPVAVQALRAAGYACDDAVVVPDGADSVERALTAEIVAGVDLIVTTGGTGLGPRDQTPEGTLRVITREIPGVSEELRRRAVAEKPAGMLSRGVAGVAGAALIVNLPGSPRAVESGMPVILSVARHIVDQLSGGDH